MKRYERTELHFSAIRIAHFLCFLVIIMLGLMGCQSKNSKTEDPEPAETVIRALCEYPGTGVYEKAEGEYYPLDAEPGKESLPDQKDDRERWESALGSFFAERCFESFYTDSNRTVILDRVAFADLTSEVIRFEEKESKDTIHYYETILQVKRDNNPIGEYSLLWRVIYSNDNTGWIQNVELEEYGSFFEAVD